MAIYPEISILATAPHMSPYLQNTIMQHLFRSASSLTGSSVYLAALHYVEGGGGIEGMGNVNFISDTAVDGGGQVMETPNKPYFVELTHSTGSYARVLVSGSWTVGTSRIARNRWQLEFNTATGSWAQVDGFALTNASQSGSYLFLWGPINTPKLVDVGDTLTIPVNHLEVNLSNAYSYYISGCILKHYLNNVIYYPATNYLALYNTLPDAADNGGIEISASSGYGRYVVSSGCWTIPTAGSISNNNTMVFVNSAAGDYGTIKGICVRNTNTGIAGSQIMKGAIYPNVTVIGPDGFMFEKGDLRIDAYWNVEHG